MSLLLEWLFHRPHPSTTVIIPTYNEEANIGATVRSVFEAATSRVQVIVTDGYSNDHTTSIARRAGAKVMRVSGGRAKQLNAGANQARASRIVFLHADTILPQAFDSSVSKVLQDPCNSIGAFRLKINAPGFGLRIVERVANWRSNTLKRPYGDQALFVRKDMFEKIGQFPIMPLLEDYEIVRRASKVGQIVIADDEVKTSARRWKTLGVVRTTLLNQSIIVGYHCGVSAERLSSWYRGALQKAIRREMKRTLSKTTFIKIPSETI